MENAELATLAAEFLKLLSQLAGENMSLIEEDIVVGYLNRTQQLWTT